MANRGSISHFNGRLGRAAGRKHPTLAPSKRTSQMSQTTNIITTTTVLTFHPESDPLCPGRRGPEVHYTPVHALVPPTHALDHQVGGGGGGVEPRSQHALPTAAPRLLVRPLPPSLLMPPTPTSAHPAMMCCWAGIVARKGRKYVNI